jgi:ATP-dependent helicase YprA (DUF1998 family)
MKKYFVVETDEAIEFGEVVNLTFFKELKDGKVTVEKDVEFTEDSKDWLIEMGFVEEREVEEEDLIDFEDEPCESLVALEEDFEALEERVDNIEGLIKEIYDTVKSITADLKKKEKKNAQPKKK